MENVEPLIEELNKLTNNEYNLILKSATLFEDADFCVIEIFYRDGIILDKATKTLLENKIFELVPKSFKYQIHFVKKFISEEQIKTDVENFMKKYFNSISFKVDDVVSENLAFSITLAVDTLAFDHANQKHLDQQIEKNLQNLYENYIFKVNLIQEKVFNVEQPELPAAQLDDEEDEFALRKINFTEAAAMIGEPFEGAASYISDIRAETENTIVCGKIKSIKQITIKRKPKAEEQDAENSESEENENSDLTENSHQENSASADENVAEAATKYERKLYKWSLEDFTGQISCTFLSNKENRPKLDLLKEGDEIAVQGNIVNDKFTNSLTVTVKKIQTCKLPENFVEYIAYKKEKPYYEFVKPEPIVVYKQDNLMNFADEVVVPKYLQDKIFVCYDFETTGFHYEAGDRIVEIGAVKIVNGKITEKFGSYVNPNGKHIDRGASEVTGIYDEDVANAPKDYEVLQDFYKFTRGATIIGYNNINFDNVFLLGQGKNCRYNFDNPTEDVFRLAQKYVSGVKNYKLGTIAEKLGVVLDNAHSAVFDALATAEVFLKIAEKL